MPGMESFHTLLRLLSLLAFETFLFGTAIEGTSFYFSPLIILQFNTKSILAQKSLLVK